MKDRTSASIARQVATCVLLGLGLAACGGGGGDSKNPQSPVPASLTTSFIGTEDQPLVGAIVTSGDWQVALVSGPLSGALTGPTASGMFTYVPGANFAGTDTFVVSASGTQTGTLQATVNLTVQAQNDAPVAAGETVETISGKAVLIDVLGNDSDVEGEQLVPRLGTVTHGSAIVQTDGRVRFTPAESFAGIASVSYVVVDQAGAASESVEALIQVQSPQKLVYFTDSALVYDDSESLRSIAAPFAVDGSLLHLEVSTNGRTALWVSRELDTKNWSHADLTQATLTAKPAGHGDTLGGTLSPAGSHLILGGQELIDEGPMRYASNRMYLRNLYVPGDIPLHDTPVVEQVGSHYFLSDGSAVIYTTNAPARFTTNVETHRFVVSTGERVTLMGPVNDPESIGDLLPLPGNSEAIYLRKENGLLRLHRTSLVTPGFGVGIGPTFNSFPTIPFLSNHQLSADGSKVLLGFNAGFVGVAPAMQLLDVGTGAVTNIGPGFSSDSSLIDPKFSRDGSRVLFLLRRPSGDAIYAASLTAPGTITQVSPTYTPGALSEEFHVADNSVVYQAQGNLYAVNFDHAMEARPLNANPDASIAYYALSPDGRAIAYAQRAAAGMPYSLFLVHIISPDSPKTITSTMLTTRAMARPFAFVP